MSPKIKRRIYRLMAYCTLAAVGVCVLFYQFSSNVSFFLTPSEFTRANFQDECRLGGLVQEGSVTYLAPDRVTFFVVDKSAAVEVEYTGPIPMIFRQGQGVVVTGKMQGGRFLARTLLTKHDEYYRKADQAS